MHIHPITNIKEGYYLFNLLKEGADTPKSTTKSVGYIFKILDLVTSKFTKDELDFATKLITTAFPKINNLYQKYTNPDNSGKYLIDEHFDLDALKLLPQNTLGKQYHDHILENHFDQDFYKKQMSCTVNNVVDFYKVRSIKIHDIYHVLSDFETDIYGEFGIQGIYLGQLVNPASLLVVFDSFAHLLVKLNFDQIGVLLDYILNGYYIGKKSKPLAEVDWEDYFVEDIDIVRKSFNININKII